MRYCRLSSGSACEATPPDAMILMWSAPLRSSSRVAFTTSGTPSAIRPVQDRPEQHAQKLCDSGAQPTFAVTTGLAERLAGDEQSRAFEQPLLDRGLDAVVGAAGVAQRGKAAMQHGAHSDRAFRGKQRKRHIGQQAQVHLGEHDVDVRVDQPRHQRATTQVDAGGGRAGERAVGDLLHGAVLDQDVTRHPATHPGAGRGSGRRGTDSRSCAADLLLTNFQPMIGFLRQLAAGDEHACQPTNYRPRGRGA